MVSTIAAKVSTTAIHKGNVYSLKFYVIPALFATYLMLMSKCHPNAELDTEADVQNVSDKFILTL